MASKPWLFRQADGGNQGQRQGPPGPKHGDGHGEAPTGGLDAQTTLYINVALLLAVVLFVAWRMGWLHVPQLVGKTLSAGGGGGVAAPAPRAPTSDGSAAAALREVRRAQMEALHAQQREQQRKAREAAAADRQRDRQELEESWVAGGTRVGLGAEGHVPDLAASPNAPVGSQRSLIAPEEARAQARTAHEGLRHRHGGGSGGAAAGGGGSPRREVERPVSSEPVSRGPGSSGHDEAVAAQVAAEEREAEERASLELAERLLGRDGEEVGGAAGGGGGGGGGSEESRKSLMAEQDKEYREALEKDRANETVKHAQAARIEGAKRRTGSSEGSSASGGEEWSVRVRLGPGHGLQMERSFPAGAPLQTLVDWIVLETEGTEPAARPAGFPDSLQGMELVVANPRKRICALDGPTDPLLTPLQDVPGLRNRTILLLRPADS
jgi:hypothetical protein